MWYKYTKLGGYMETSRHKATTKKRKKPAPLVFADNQAAADIPTLQDYSHLEITVFKTGQSIKLKLAQSREVLGRESKVEINKDEIKVHVPILSSFSFKKNEKISGGHASQITTGTSNGKNILVKKLAHPTENSFSTSNPIYLGKDELENPQSKHIDIMYSIVSELYIRSIQGFPTEILPKDLQIFLLIEEGEKNSVEILFQMENVKGNSLSKELETTQCPESRLNIVRKFISILILFKNNKIMHGDMTLNNFMWTGNKMIVLDISTFCTAYTKALYYNSRDENISPTEDYFAASCIIFKILTGDYPSVYDENHQWIMGNKPSLNPNDKGKLITIFMARQISQGGQQEFLRILQSMLNLKENTHIEGLLSILEQPLNLKNDDKKEENTTRQQTAATPPIEAGQDSPNSHTPLDPTNKLSIFKELPSKGEENVITVTGC